jgi:hypothetical protein
MIRGILLACSLALLTQLSIPTLASAQEPKKAEQPEGREEWRARLLTANQLVARAQQRNATALRTYEIMRHRRHPRGEGKRAIMDELELSREALATAQQNLEKLETAARHAGAPPSWLKFKREEIDAPEGVPASPNP